MNINTFCSAGTYIPLKIQWLLCLVFAACSNPCYSQLSKAAEIKNDSLLVINKKPEKGFYNDYILFIPKGTPVNTNIYLLVEPNNSGILSDSIEIHKKAAINLASVRSIGNNISTELKIPLLVPIFPRPSSQPLVYSHALDRDVMIDYLPGLERPDLQLLDMIEDAKNILSGMNIMLHSTFFMNGFSASASFTNRFSFLHPEKIKALAIGGFNGELMLPQQKINSYPLNYPLGINDFYLIKGKHFDSSIYSSIPQFIYMGKLDDNDAVQYDDAYNENERQIINDNIGKNVQERFTKCQDIYLAHHIKPIFKTYEAVGHWTTGAINMEVIQFFQQQMQLK